MKSIISIFAMVVLVASGVFGASVLKSYQIENNTYPDFIPWVEHTMQETSADDAQLMGGGMPEGKSSHSSIEELSNNFYLNFNKQFVVPVISGSKVEALIVISLAIEVAREEEQLVTAIEPKLRDALTRTLLSLANEGVFDANITETDTIKKVQKRLTKVTKAIIGKSMKNVLILDIARQDR